eukprot:3945253-Amphidinium_carterae.1
MGSLTDDFDAEPSSCSFLHLRPGGDRRNERFGSPPGGKKSVKRCRPHGEKNQVNTLLDEGPCGGKKSWKKSFLFGE